MNIKKLGLYAVFWLILTQNFTIERLIIGILVCVAVFIFNKDLLCIHKNNNSSPILNIKYLLIYIIVFIKEIFKSNFHVAKIVLSPELSISTSIVTIKTKLKDDFNKTVLANSITLTPGTLTLDMTEDKLVIHCLDAESAESLENNILENILLKKEELINE